MKRFWLVLLSLGLVVAFSASAFAVDVKFSGYMYAGGLYMDKLAGTKSNAAGSVSSDSTSFYFQKMQLNTEFVAAPGVSLVTRANIMERVWGGNRTAATTGGTPSSQSDALSAATKSENQNIGFDYAYINYASPIGIFKVGYQNDSAFGTTFGDSSTPRGQINYSLPIGSFTVGAKIVKYQDSSYYNSNTTGATTTTDADKDKYSIYGVYTGKNLEAGLLGNYYNDASTRQTANYRGRYYSVTPYAKAIFGPVALQAEVNYAFGKYKQFENGTSDVDLSSLSAMVDALATFGPVYVGGTFAYSQGQGSDTTGTNVTKQNVSSATSTGADWNPCLIIANTDYFYWSGSTSYYGANGAAVSSSEPAGANNIWLFQVRGGVKPTDKLNIGASVTYASLDQKWNGTSYTDLDYSKDLGWEVDVTGSYKITNNLSYLLGFGYLFSGDYFKGLNKASESQNTYLVINKLTFTF